MMLKPFQIRDLHVSPSPSHEERSDHSTSHGVVQISAADYDDITSNHPRARLTYMDDDDGDQITVGSSLELSQRLDEAIGIRSQLESVPLSQDEPTPVHIFDIRRSNSVTELWRQFEHTPDDRLEVHETQGDVPATVRPAVDHPVPEEASAPENTASATSAPGDESQPLMAAFEAELASILDSAETSENRAPQPEPSPAVESSANTRAQRTSPSVEDLVAQVLDHLRNGVTVMQSELSSKMPELRRHLKDAQRDLPENITTSLQALLAQLEAQMRTAFSHLPDGGRQLAEEAMQAGRPVAENAAESLWSIASDFDQARRTLFAAFENEFGRTGSHGTSTRTDGPNAAPGASPDVTSNETVPSAPNPQETETRPVVTSVQKKEAEGSSQSTASEAKPTNQVSSSRPSRPTRMVPPGRFPRDLSPPRPPSYFPPQHPLSRQSSSFRPAQPQYWGPSPAWHQYHHQFPPHPHFNGYSPPPPPKPYSAPRWPFQWPPLPPVHPFGHSRLTRRSDVQTEAPGNDTLFIGNVGFNVTERMIQDVFASKGFIVDVDLPLDAVSGKHAGFGYLHFPSVHPAMAAMNALQGAHIDGHAINLEFSDCAPIDRVHSPRRSTGKATRSAGVDHAHEASNASGSEQVSSEENPAQQKRDGSIKRRKSVAFQEPARGTSPRGQGTKTSANANPTRAGSYSLVDLTTDESGLIPPSEYREALSRDPNAFPNAKPDVEMSRFPPVSQFEAQLVANQQRASESRPATTTSEAANDRDVSSHGRFSICQVPSYPAPELEHGRPRFLYNVQGTRVRCQDPFSPEMTDFDKLPLKPTIPGLRRSNTTTFARPGVRSPDTLNPASSEDPHNVSRLRRRATERHSLRPGARQDTETDTWARLDRRERRRSGPLSRQSIPGSFPVEETSQPPANSSLDTNVERVKETDFDRCVTSLINMGYGTAQDGGRSRMGVYAAAANGNLVDAIEMIEEERQAYARHGRK